MLLWAAAAGAIGAASATSLAPITLDEQIASAARIFRGQVVESRAVEESAGGGRRIVTIVRFVPLTVYKGEVPSPIELRFLGGRVGDTEMRVDGMPEFEIGHEYVLFVSDEENLACPVIGWTWGSLPVDPASGTVELSEPVAAGLRAPLAARAVATKSPTPPPGGPGELRMDVFETALRERIREVGKK